MYLKTKYCPWVLDIYLENAEDIIVQYMLISKLQAGFWKNPQNLYPGVWRARRGLEVGVCVPVYCAGRVHRVQLIQVLCSGTSSCNPPGLVRHLGGHLEGGRVHGVHRPGHHESAISARGIAVPRTWQLAEVLPHLGVANGLSTVAIGGAPHPYVLVRWVFSQAVLGAADWAVADRVLALLIGQVRGHPVASQVGYYNENKHMN